MLGRKSHWMHVLLFFLSVGAAAYVVAFPSCGPARGVVLRSGVNSFVVPFGRAERFEDAQGVSDWTNVRNALEVGPACSQLCEEGAT